MNRTLAVLAMSASLFALAPATSRASGAFPGGIWTLQDENASISTQALTDRYYVNGVHLGWTSNAGEVPGAVAAFGHAVLGQGRQRISISLTQKIFTPAATTLINPPANDEPYAGSLLASFSLIQDTAGSRTIMGFDTGVFGRDAGAEIVQNTTHAIIGQGRTHGWAYQLPSEPAFDLFASRIWRLRLTAPGAGLQADALPQLSAMAGTTEIYAEPGVVFRLGEGLDADFGAPLISPGPSGGDAFSTRHFAWYVFAGAGAKLVAHDEYLQGTLYQTSRSVRPNRVVGSFEAGVALIWRGVRLTYTQVFQTERFHGQSGGIHEYGSLAATVRF
ncbi:MAG TPA: lipid A deacylase LpxR family protein [Acidiphilium sp.]|nr:lipid A deacylase LpxR family protein [Acidiphilium sp.]